MKKECVPFGFHVVYEGETVHYWDEDDVAQERCLWYRRHQRHWPIRKLCGLKAAVEVLETRQGISETARPFGESADSWMWQQKEAVDLRALRRELLEAMETLSYRERAIIGLWFGIDEGCIYTLEEIGGIFNVTRERVRQIALKGIRKLGGVLRKEPKREDEQ